MLDGSVGEYMLVASAEIRSFLGRDDSVTTLP